jgi:hypothetical protein
MILQCGDLNIHPSTCLDHKKISFKPLNRYHRWLRNKGDLFMASCFLGVSNFSLAKIRVYSKLIFICVNAYLFGALCRVVMVCVMDGEL